MGRYRKVSAMFGSGPVAGPFLRGNSYPGGGPGGWRTIGDVPDVCASFRTKDMDAICGTGHQIIGGPFGLPPAVYRKEWGGGLRGRYRWDDGFVCHRLPRNCCPGVVKPAISRLLYAVGTGAGGGRPGTIRERRPTADPFRAAWPEWARREKNSRRGRE